MGLLLGSVVIAGVGMRASARAPAPPDGDLGLVRAPVAGAEDFGAVTSRPAEWIDRGAI